MQQLRVEQLQGERLSWAPTLDQVNVPVGAKQTTVGGRGAHVPQDIAIRRGPAWGQMSHSEHILARVQHRGEGIGEVKGCI